MQIIRYFSNLKSQINEQSNEKNIIHFTRIGFSFPMPNQKACSKPVTTKAPVTSRSFFSR